MVLSLPTRNGNRDGWKLTAVSRHCFEPTYKEWKPGITLEEGEGVWIRFEPTYKEWKRFYPYSLIGVRQGFEPTYKEWKRTKAPSPSEGT